MLLHPNPIQIREGGDEWREIPVCDGLGLAFGLGLGHRRLLVGRVNVPDRTWLILTHERRAHALGEAAPLARRAQLAQHVVDVDLARNVVDGQDMRADADVLEALARRAVVAARVPHLALRHAPLHGRVPDDVHREASVDEGVEGALPVPCACVRHSTARRDGIGAGLLGREGGHAGQVLRG